MNFSKNKKFFIFFLIIIFQTNFLYASEFDTILDNTEKLLIKGDLVNADNESNILEKYAVKNNSILSNEEKIKTYLILAKIKLNLGKVESSFKYIKIVEKLISNDSSNHKIKNSLSLRLITLDHNYYQGVIDNLEEQYLNLLEEAENNLLQTDLLFLNIYNSIAKYYDFIGEQKKSEKYFLKSNIFITQNKLNSTLLTRNLFDLAMLYLNDEERRSDGLNIYRKVKKYINFETSNYNHSIYIAKGIEALIALEEDKIKESIQKQLDQIDYTKKYLGENSMYLAEPYGILGLTYGIFFENSQNKKEIINYYNKSVDYLSMSMRVGSKMGGDHIGSVLFMFGISAIKMHLIMPEYKRKLGVGIDFEFNDKKKLEDKIQISKLKRWLPSHLNPTERNGLKKLDYITHINNKEVYGLTQDEVYELLSGEENTEVKFNVQREDNTFQVTFKRKPEEIKPIHFAQMNLCEKDGALYFFKHILGQNSYNERIIATHGFCSFALLLNKDYDNALYKSDIALRFLKKHLSDESKKSSKFSSSEQIKTNASYIASFHLASLYKFLSGDAPQTINKVDIDFYADFVNTHNLLMDSQTIDAFRSGIKNISLDNKNLNDLVNLKKNNLLKIEKLEKIYSKIIEENSDKKNIIKIQNQISKTKKNNEEINNKIKIINPKFYDLVNYSHINILDHYTLIKDNEVIVLASRLSDDGGIAVSIISNKTIKPTVTVNYEVGDIRNNIDKIREALDINSMQHNSEYVKFPYKDSYKIFLELTKGLESFEGIEKIVFIVDTNFLDIPFWTLTTEKYNADNEKAEVTNSKFILSDNTIKDFRNAPWIGKKYSISVLPSLDNFIKLRKSNKDTSSFETFVGFGHPKFKNLNNLIYDTFYSVSLKLSNFFTIKGNIDVEKLSELPSLEASKEELKTISEFFKKNKSRLFFQEDFNEDLIKNFDFTNTDVIAFSTHALVTGEIENINDAGLVLSIPNEITDTNDAYLSTSDIASLNLNADIVILSACNTAGGGEFNSKPLSGLAKSFFYAGAKSLLVSNWSVETKSSKNITVNMMKNIKEKNLSKAEALRLSIQDLLNDNSENYFAHPAFWAPFNLISD